MEIQKQINELKPLLAKAETAYTHAIAANDMASISLKKKEVSKYRRMIGKLIKERMAQ